MKDHNIPLKYTDVDLLEGYERTKVIKDAYSYCRGCGFPIIVIDENTVIEGFNESRLREVLHIES
jgi:glutaredoxin